MRYLLSCGSLLDFVCEVRGYVASGVYSISFVVGLYFMSLVFYLSLCWMYLCFPSIFIVGRGEVNREGWLQDGHPVTKCLPELDFTMSVDI